MKMIAPRVGVVIPVYKHPKLVSEAISSALLQSDGGGLIICIVNDGCPLRETDEVIRSWASAHPDRVKVVKTVNAGLSAARNAGIRFLMKAYPLLEAFFFLDADNLLDTNASSAFSIVLDRHPELDWFYPQFDMFGLEAMKSAGGTYSLLRHSKENSCEAGSLVRRRVFEAGVLYDETMRLGYEDWDFWLTAASKGFRGMPFEQTVFRYRKRPESMLAGSHSHDAEIRGYMRRKHSWLYSQKAISLEHIEAPRYRVFLTSIDRVVCITDPLGPENSMPFDDIAIQYWQSRHAPEKYGSGHLWVFANHTHWQALKNAGLLRYALWDLERRSAHNTISFSYIQPDSNEGFGYTTAGLLNRSLTDCSLAAIPSTLISGIMADKSLDWLLSLDTPTPQPSISRAAFSIPAIFMDVMNVASSRCVAAPYQSRAGVTRDCNPVSMLTSIISTVKSSPFRDRHVTDGTWRSSWLPDRNDAAHWTRQAVDCNVVYPSIGYFGKQPTVCFLLTIAEFGGVEAVTANAAKILRNAGFRTAVCMIGTRRITLIEGLEDAFDEILWFPHDSFTEFSGQIYEGTHLPREPEYDLARDLMGLLVAFNVVISCHGGASVAALGALRRKGVITAMYEHVLDRGSYGRTYGTPQVALAYEAAVDYILTCSKGLGDWLADHGVPDTKIIRVPNAAGYPLSEHLRSVIHPRLANDKHPLRLLFLGRFDRQKGLDRLADIVELVSADGLNVEWKIHGKSVIDGASDAEARLVEQIKVSPPVTSVTGRTELFTWADILIVPSRFEGLPLVVLEAQRCGAVPIVARCGMVEEAVDHGVDGLLVSQDHCVEEMVTYIKRLECDRSLLGQLSQNAHRKTLDWDVQLSPLLTILTERLCGHYELKRNSSS